MAKVEIKEGGFLEIKSKWVHEKAFYILYKTLNSKEAGKEITPQTKNILLLKKGKWNMPQVNRAI